MDSESKAGLAILGFWLFALLLKLGFLVGVIYVAVHFISKYW